MEDIDKAFRAVSDSLLDYIREDTDTKYGPVAREERELKNLLEKGDFENYLISRLPSDRYATIKEVDGVRTLLVDTESIPKPVLLEHSKQFQRAYEQMGGLAIGNRTGIAPAVGDSKNDVHEVYQLNEHRLPSQLLPAFEEALVLRAVEQKKSLSRGTVFDWRGEIAGNYGENGGDPQVAQYLISLCSTGYFDEDDIFDQMYDDLVHHQSYSIQEFRQTVGKYVKQNPFAVFVRADGMNGDETFHLANGKLDQVNEFPASPGFVDICGKGEDTHPIIDDTRDIFNKREDYDMKTRRNQEIGQKILRIKTKDC